MKRFHLLVGVILLIVFLLTGQFMDRFLGHLQGMSDGPRMLYRSRHIFILLSGLVHLLIGTYFQYRTGSWRRFLQLLGSILLTLSSVLLIVAFFKEPVMTGLRVPFSQNGIYLAAAGALLHWLASMATNEVRRITNNDLGTEPN